MKLETILARARYFQAQGANVIDLGCLPNTPFPHLSDAILTLKAAGLKVSVDSLNAEDLLLAGKSGADYLLSLTEHTLWIAEEVSAIPVLIPAKSGNLSSLYRAIERMQEVGKPFIADAILDRIVHDAHRIELKGESMRKKRQLEPENNYQ